jgi:hypothetical protein
MDKLQKHVRRTRTKISKNIRNSETQTRTIKQPIRKNILTVKAPGIDTTAKRVTNIKVKAFIFEGPKLYRE